MQHTLLFMTFIRENPGFIAWLIGGLVTGIGAVVAAAWGLVASRISKLEATDAALASRVGEVEVTLGKYEAHIGAGDNILKTLGNRIERHMTEEEDKVWNGIYSLGTQLSRMEKENLEAHSVLTERIARVETKMPNGQLEKMIGMLQILTDRR